MGVIELLRSIGRNIHEGIRQNKLAASLSLIALVVTTAFALTSNYDERPRYRKVILPEISKSERQFRDVMRDAEQEPDERWRLLYFIEAHRRAKSALRLVRSERPMTPTGKKAQAELIRYYELVDEELAIIRTEMSNNDAYDYIAAWEKADTELLPIRARWEQWLDAPAR